MLAAMRMLRELLQGRSEWHSAGRTYELPEATPFAWADAESGLQAFPSGSMTAVPV